MEQRYTKVIRTAMPLALMLVVCGTFAQQGDTASPPPPAMEEPSAVIEAPEETIETPGQAEEELERQFSLREPGISGVVIDRTITMTGRTFYRQFSQLSLERPVLNNVVLTVHERPSARWGSQVWITQGNNRVVYQATMSPRLSDIDQYVQGAVEQVEELVIQQTLRDALDNNPDLADEEI